MYNFCNISSENLGRIVAGIYLVSVMLEDQAMQWLAGGEPLLLMCFSWTVLVLFIASLA